MRDFPGARGETCYHVAPELVFCFIFREYYGNVIFLYISDDLDWGKRKIGIKRETAKDLYFVGEGHSSAENR